jgi:S-adenosylmethionine:tRNA ribosyltransferase-isomerase
VHPGRKVRSGERIVFDERLTAEVLGRNEHGERIVGSGEGDLMEAIEHLGHALLPYIRRADEASDRERYQTVRGASWVGGCADGGLHFT